MTSRPVIQVDCLHLDRLPGFDSPFTVEAAPGINLITGPNESGKSSLARTVFQLLWPETPVVRPLTVRGEFSVAGEKLQAARLDDGPVNWTREGAAVPGPDLPTGHLARCYRLGLLDLHRADGADLEATLAREIRKQMAGGFDLAQVRSLFPERTGLVTRRRNASVQANQELQQCLGSQRRLAAEERGLDDLLAEKAQAELAARHRDQLQAAVEYMELGTRLSGLQKSLAELPDRMGTVRPDDEKRLADLLERRRAAAERGERLRQKVAAHAAGIAELAVGEDLTELGNIVAQAESMQAQSRESAKGAAAAEAAAADARRELAPELLRDDIPAEGRQAYDRLLAIHRELAAVTAEQAVLTRLLSHEALAAKDPDTEGADPSVVQALHADSLRPVTGAALARAVATLGLAGALLVLGEFSNFQPDRLWGAALVLATLGAAGVGNWWRQRRAHDRARQELEARCRQAGQPLDAGWTPARATQALLAQSRQNGLETGRGESRDAIRTTLTDQLKTAAAAAEEARSRRRDLLRDLNRDESRDTPDLLHELDQLSRYRAAREREIAAQAAAASDQAALLELLAAGQTVLEKMGLNTAGTLAAIKAGLAQLRERRTKVAGLQKLQSADTESLADAEAERAKANADYAEICRRLELRPEDPEITDQVAARIAALPRFQQLSQERANARRDQEQLARHLDGGEGLPDRQEILGLSVAELESRLADQKVLAAQAPELSERIARLRERIAQARQREDLSQAQAQATERATDLAEARAEQRDNLLGRLLLDRTIQRHETSTQPPVLTAMNEHLGRFTGGNYRLRVAGDQGDRFVALDNAERRLELSALSDGTRAQLLLAARLAFLNTVEGGLQAPLFLDEALTASDPARFDAVARAMGQLNAATGRQVFYLSSNPSDCTAWQRALAGAGLAPAREIDLAAERLGAAAAPPQTLAELPAADVPEPGSRTTVEYGTLLQVPRLQPWAHENTVHLYYLLPEDLPLLHTLLLGGIRTLGQWRLQGRDLIRAGMIAESSAAQVTERGRLYGAFLDVWRCGRGRPLTPEVLAECGQFSAKMLTAAKEVLAETGPEAAVFVAAVNQGRIKRLQQTKKEALQEFLERHGYLDQRDIWSADQIVAHVLGALGETILQPATVRLLVRHLFVLMNSGSA